MCRQVPAGPSTGGVTPGRVITTKTEDAEVVALLTGTRLQCWANDGRVTLGAARVQRHAERERRLGCC